MVNYSVHTLDGVETMLMTKKVSRIRSHDECGACIYTLLLAKSFNSKSIFLIRLTSPIPDACKMYTSKPIPNSANQKYTKIHYLFTLPLHHYGCWQLINPNEDAKHM